MDSIRRPMAALSGETIPEIALELVASRHMCGCSGERVLWAASFGLLVFVESLAILKDRSKQARTLKEQMTKLEELRVTSDAHSKSMMRQLMAANDPAQGLKRRALNLSEAILNFIFERMQNAPPTAPLPYLFTASFNSSTYGRFLTEQQDRINAAIQYPQETIRFYETRFSGSVEEIKREFAQRNLSDPLLDNPPTGDVNTRIRTIAERIGVLAEKIQVTEVAA